MLNGRTEGDMKGDLTCFTSSGCSTVDYTLVTSNFFPFVISFSILLNDTFTHLPQSFSLKRKPIVLPVHKEENVKSSSQRYTLKWTEYSTERLFSGEVDDLISEFYVKLNSEDVSGSVDEINSIFQHVCKTQKVSKKPKERKPRKSQWWDEEVEEMRKLKYKRLRLLKLEHSETALLGYRIIRNS